ncbi:MAG: tetratricopeptide repeat protein, partial [Gemmatimonadales bacterium]
MECYPYRYQGFRGDRVTEQDGSAETAAKTDDRPPFVRELFQRGVVQAGLAYLIVGWLLIQIADVTADNIGLPAWTATFVTFTVIGGFPITLLLAWFLEYAEGRLVVDEGKQSGRVIAGLGSNYLAVIGAYAIAAIGATVYQFTVGFEVPDDFTESQVSLTDAALPVDPNSIGVLRFLNIDGGETSQIFSEGLAEDVLDRLAKVPGLLVSSRGDSWSLRDNASSSEVRRRLRVAYFLEGSVRLDGDTLRTVVQLIDSATGFHVVSRTFDRKLRDIMDVQDEITALIVANLRVALPPDTQMHFASSFQSDDVDAYVLYRRGRELFDEPQTEDSLRQVIEYYSEALTIDPGYAAAHAGLCITFAAMYDVSSDESHVRMAESACATALTTSPNLHMVYTALGDLYVLTGRTAEAEKAYSQSVQINGQDAQAMRGMADVYELQQRLDEAEGQLREAIRLQPGNWRTIDALGTFYFANGRYSDAADAYRKILYLDPGNFQGHGNLGSALLMEGKFEQAASELERSLAIEPDRYFYSNLGIIYYYLDQFEESVAIHRKVVELSPDSSFVWLNLGDALLFSSESDQAQAAFKMCAQLAEQNLEVNPSDSHALYELAWARAMLGDTDDAS